MNETIHSLYEEIGRQRALIEVLEQKIALLEKELFLVKQEKGRNLSLNDPYYYLQGKEIMNNSQRNYLQGQEQNTNNQLNHLQGQSQNTNTPPSLPLNEWIALRNEKLVAALQKDFYKRVRISAVENGATILLYLIENKSLKHTEAAKLMGLSMSGTGKRIASMKKIGLIKRTGFQQFSITSMAHQLIVAVMASMPLMMKTDN